MKSFSVAFEISSDQKSFPMELFITWAKRQVQDLRRSRMSQSCFFTGTRLGTQSLCVFGLAIWRSESRISLRYLEITSSSIYY